MYNLHALVLCGGRGTRSENPKIPKILQSVGEEATILSLVLEALSVSGIKHATFLLSHLGSEIQSKLIEYKPKNNQIQIDWLFDDGLSGTSGAVNSALEVLGTGDYALVLGDLALRGNFGSAASEWKKSGKEAAFLCHPNLHPQDSDTVYLDQDGSPITFLRKKSNSDFQPYPSISLGGIAFIRHSARRYLFGSETDVVSALIHALLPNDEVLFMNSSLYFKDSGTADRIQKIRTEYSTGAMFRRGDETRKAIFVDRDGTLIPDTGTSRKNIEIDELETETIEAIQRANKMGIPIFMVSNQPGLAKGQIKYSDFLRTQAQLQKHLLNQGAFLDDYRICPHHPDKGFDGEVKELKTFCLCRKPNDGLLRELSKLHKIDLSQSFVIGDTENDSGAAMNAGATYLFSEHGNTNFRVAAQIHNAIDRIIK